MNKILFYSIVLSLSILTSCRKEDDKPENNILVIVDQNGKTTVTQALTNTSISGSFDPSFDVSASTPSGDYRIGIGQFSYAPDHITFTSPIYLNNINMFLSNTVSGDWTATRGNVNIETKFGSDILGNGGAKFMKFTLNNVQFTRESFYNPNPPADTIWVSGIINVYRK